MIDEIMNAPDASDADHDVIGEQVPTSFHGRIDYGYLYHRMFSGLQHLHATNQDARAHELFYSSISDFGSLWDEIFVRNFVRIQNAFPDNTVTQYRLHKVEFSRLLQRAGIAPRPDVRLVINPDWQVPKDVATVAGAPSAGESELASEDDNDIWAEMEAEFDEGVENYD